MADRLRDDALALESLERYLELVPNASNRLAVEARIEILRESIARSGSVQTPAPGTPPPTVVEPSVPPATTPVPSTTPAPFEQPVPSEPSVPTQPSFVAPEEVAAASPPSEPAAATPSRSPVGFVLLGGGGAALASGVVLLVLGLQDKAAVEGLPDGATWADYRER